MIYYEVNADVEKDIYNDYLLYLNTHIKKILSFPGFIEAVVLKNNDSNNPNMEQIIVTYKLESIHHLDDYLETQAAQLRFETLELFGKKLTITRRILKLQNIFN